MYYRLSYCYVLKNLQQPNCTIQYYSTVDTVAGNKWLSLRTFSLSFSLFPSFYLHSEAAHCSHSASNVNGGTPLSVVKGFLSHFPAPRFSQLVLLFKVVDFHWTKTFFFPNLQAALEWSHIFTTSAAVSLYIFNLVSWKWIDPNCCCPLHYLLQLRG